MDINEVYRDAKDTGAEVTPTYKKAITWLLDSSNKDVIKTKIEENKSIELSDYFGLPSDITDNFTLDEVELLKDFSSELKKYYSSNKKSTSKSIS